MSESGVTGYWVKPPGARAVFIGYSPSPEDIADLERRKITDQLAAEISALEEKYKVHRAETSKREKTPPPALVRAIAAYEAHIGGVTAEDVLSKKRPRKFAWPRQRVCARLRGYGYGYNGIGRALGIHHTTAYHGACAHQKS